MTDCSHEDPFPPPMTNICLPMDAAAPYPLSKGIGSAVSQEPLLGVYTSTASSQLTPSLPPVKYSCCPCNPCTPSPRGYYICIYILYIYLYIYIIYIHIYIYFLLACDNSYVTLPEACHLVSYPSMGVYTVPSSVHDYHAHHISSCPVRQNRASPHDLLD